MSAAPVAAQRAGSPTPQGAATVPDLRAWWSWPRLADVVLPTVLVLVALLPLWPVYLAGNAVVAGIGGVVLGAAVAGVGAWRRWSALTVVAVSLLTLVVCAALAAPTTALGGFLPTLETWHTVGVSVVRVWRQVLTLLPPMGDAGGLLTVVYLLAFVGAVTAVTLALRTRRTRSLALIPPAVVLVAALLLGTRTLVAPALTAGLFTVIGLGWTAWRSGRLQTTRPFATAALAVAGVVGVGAGLVFGPAPADRYVLRDHVDPPRLDQSYPSPLAGFRSYLKLHLDDTLFTLDGAPEGARVRLATLDSYDGLVWDVTSNGSASGGSFLRATDRFVTEVAPGSIDINVTIGDYSDVWLPLLGSAQDVTFTQGRTRELADGVFLNRETETAIVTAGLRAGDAYTLTTQATPQVEAADLAGQTVSSRSMPPAQPVPEALAAQALRLTDGASTDVDRARALADGLAAEGFFSHGLEGDVPSDAGHGLARLAQMLDETEMIGDAEQYAALMALMARSLNWPSRVVLGFQQEGNDSSWDVTGRDVTAWVEIHFDDVGWVVFEPTPDENNVPQSEDPTPQDRPRPQVLQPPPPPNPAPDVPNLGADDAPVEPQPEPQEEPELSPVVRWAYLLGIPIILLVAPFAVIAAIKARRRRKRRVKGQPTGRIAGGWRQVTDTARDLGLEKPPSATRTQEAASLDEHFGTSLRQLAITADGATFAPEHPEPAAAVGYWADVASAERSLRGKVGWWRRVRSRFSLASLRKPVQGER